MEAYELRQQADGEPPADSEIDMMLEENQYGDILRAVLEWKGRVSPQYFERFHDADPDMIKAAAQHWKTWDISLFGMFQRSVCFDRDHNTIYHSWACPPPALLTTAIVWGGAAFRGIIEIQRREGITAMTFFVALFMSGIYLLLTPTYPPVVYSIWSLASTLTSV